MINVRGTALEQQCYCPNSDQTCLHYQTMMLPKNPCVGRVWCRLSAKYHLMLFSHSSCAALLFTTHGDFDTRHYATTSTIADPVGRLSDTAADHSLLAITRHSPSAGCFSVNSYQWSAGWCRRRYTTTIGRPVCTRSVNGRTTTQPALWHGRGICNC
jgi:hypothetical protein